jgi:hypothetical protein
MDRHHLAQTGIGDHVDPFDWIPESPLPGGKGPEREADFIGLLPFSAEVYNSRNFSPMTPILLYDTHARQVLNYL